MKRRTLLAASILPLASLTGCVTSSLLEESRRTTTQEYTETITHMLLTADRKQLVLIGPQYHYIVDAPPRFGDILDSPLYPRMQIAFERFEVSTEAELRGNLWLRVDQPTPDERAMAKALGMYEDCDCANVTAAITSRALNGKRYRSGLFGMPANAQPLRQPYTLQVEETSTGGRKALVALTPLAAAADGALILLSLPLVPFYINAKPFQGIR